MTSIIKALNQATASEGGYTVPKEYSARMLALVQEKSITMQDMDVRNMNHEVQYIPKVTNGSTAYIVPELGTITESQPSFGQITLTAKKIASLVPASTEVLEDNNVSLANFLVEQMAKDIALKIDKENYSGTGEAWYGLRHTSSFSNAVQPDGLDGATVTAGNISLMGIVKAVGEVLADNHAQPDISYWNPRTITSLLALTDGSARPVLNQETFASPTARDGVIYRLYGTRAKMSGVVPINISYGTASGEDACSDALVGNSKEMAIQGQRRGFIWKTDYDIDTDKYKWQTTTRMAFAMKYPDSYCLIRGIKD